VIARDARPAYPAEHMFERAAPGPVLGVDPGTASVGLAIVSGGGGRGQPMVLWAETLRTPPGLSAAERLRRIYGGVRAAIAEQRPEAVAVERLMWGRNTGSAMEVARASGVILLAAAEAGVPVEEYAPLEVKMSVTGVGNAPKPQVRRGLVRILGTEGLPTDPDAADAVAVAVCHLHQSGLRRLTGGAAR
jgi:crossover junction endodeoxyribonuclease RuvC